MSVQLGTKLSVDDYPDLIRECKRANMSVYQYIQIAILEKLERDTDKSDEEIEREHQASAARYRREAARR